MKNILLLILMALVTLCACKEKEIAIPELSVGDRKVIVEELTGVRCTACPDGARLLENQQELYGDKLIVVSIHEAPDFSVPYDESTYDFRTVKGKEMFDFIGVYEGVPAASIARLVPPNYITPFVTVKSLWPGFIATELSKDYGLGLFVKNDYDPANRKLDVLVNIAPGQDIDGDNRLTVVITQDSIIDRQLDNNVLIEDYVHRHVLREVLTKASGDDITEPLTSGALISRNFSMTLPADWVAEHCSVVAYVHHTGTPDKIVLQAAEEHVVE
ncbi:MAG: Omp28-related outer membrane protein [Lewinellaceae bacterium]|nr:Omp28-related outer membrane protein [Saprospiraceae bacterium]MCB9344164.1 Omp28-related outer membrane protein [Lewinellaceae bacterium]